MAEGFCERLEIQSFPVLYSFLSDILVDYKKYKQLQASNIFSCIISSMLNEKVPFPVKKEFIINLKKSIIAWPELSKFLLDSFNQKVSKVAATVEMANELTVKKLRSFYFSTLLAILPSNSSYVTLPIFEKIAVLSHHQLLVPALNPGLFKKCTRRIPQFSLETFMETEMNAFVKDLFSTQLLLNSSIYIREASTELCRTLVEQIKNKDLSHSIIQSLDPLFEDTWSTFTDEEVSIYNTPVGTVFRQPKEVKVVKFRNEEERWAEESRLAKLAKEGKEDAKVKAERERILKEEDVVREKLKVTQLKIEQAINVLTCISFSRPEMLNSIIFVLMPRIIKIMASPVHQKLLEDKIPKLAQRCFRFSTMGCSIGIGLVVCFSSFAEKNLKFKNESISTLLEEVNVKITPERLFSEVQFGLLFPFITYILTTKQAAAPQHLAFQLIEKHVKSVHPPQLIELISTIVKTTKRLQQRATAALLAANQKVDFKGGESASIDVLLDTFQSPELTLRSTAIDSLMLIPNLSESKSSRLIYVLWWGKCDSDYSVASKSNQLFSSLNFSITEDYLAYLLPLLSKENDELRQIAARAITAALVIFPETFNRTQKELFSLYLSSLPNDEQSYDKELCANFVYTRSGIISCLNSSGRLACTAEQILDTYRFFLDSAFPLETDSSTRNRILTTGKNIITFQGKAHLNVLLPMLLEYLKKTDLPNLVYEQVIIYIGLLSKNFVSAQGMEKEMAIITVIINTTTEFDSQEIRVASSYALAEIISPFKAEGKKLIYEYFILLYGTDAQLSERKGYAYILAGLIKGVGVRITLAEILSQLIANLDGKNGVDARLGAVLLLEGLIGERLFEPYLIHIINPS
jgi:hypothetical protein